MQKINWKQIIKNGNTEYLAQYKNFIAETTKHGTCYSITISKNKIDCNFVFGFTTANSCKNYFRKFLIKNANLNK